MKPKKQLAILAAILFGVAGLAVAQSQYRGTQTTDQHAARNATAIAAAATPNAVNRNQATKAVVAPGSSKDNRSANADYKGRSTNPEQALPFCDSEAAISPLPNCR